VCKVSQSLYINSGIMHERENGHSIASLNHPFLVSE